MCFSVACGTSNSNSSHNLSHSQSQAVVQELNSAVVAAFVSGLQVPMPADRAEPRRLPAIVRNPRPALTEDCISTETGETCNIPISFTGPCPNGGAIAVDGDFIFTLDNSGNGNDSSTLIITPTNCALSDLTINGDPNVTVATQFSFQDNAVDYPITFTEIGGISFGPNPSGSCVLNVKLAITSATTCTVTGTLCGQTLSGSC